MFASAICLLAVVSTLYFFSVPGRFGLLWFHGNPVPPVLVSQVSSCSQIRARQSVYAYGVPVLDRQGKKEHVALGIVAVHCQARVDTNHRPAPPLIRHRRNAHFLCVESN